MVSRIARRLIAALALIGSLGSLTACSGDPAVVDTKPSSSVSAGKAPCVPSGSFDDYTKPVVLCVVFVFHTK